MPLFDYICMSSHATEVLVRNRDNIPDYIRCAFCGGPAFRKEYGYKVNHSMRGRTLTTDTLDSYREAAAQMEHTYKSTDDPAVKAANPPEVWHAAKVRAEARQLAGARTFDKDKPEWNHREVS